MLILQISTTRIVLICLSSRAATNSIIAVCFSGASLRTMLNAPFAHPFVHHDFLTSFTSKNMTFPLHVNDFAKQQRSKGISNVGGRNKRMAREAWKHAQSADIARGSSGSNQSDVGRPRRVSFVHRYAETDANARPEAEEADLYIPHIEHIE